MTVAALQPNTPTLRAFTPPAPAMPPTVPCSPRAESHLALMLSDNHSDLLSEWLSAFMHSGKRLTDASLSSLLKYIRFRAEHWNEVDTIITSHGYPPDEGGKFYINSYNADHKYDPYHLSTEKIKEVWHAETLNERSVLLIALRTNDPDYARELLQSTWKTEPLKARSRLLGDLHINLSIADEPFIESALDDRGGAVRRVAADLLVKLPVSRFVRRMIDRVVPLLSYHPVTRTGTPARISVTLPTAHTSDMQRDGIYARSLYYGMDEPSFWLCNMLGNIPPQTWMHYWNASALELVEAANNASKGNKQILIKGWQDACYHNPAPDWAEAFVQFCYPLTENEGRAWLALMLSHKREEVVTRVLTSEPHAIYSSEMPLDALWRLETPWSPIFSRFILARLHPYIDPTTPEDPAILEALPRIARALSPATSDEAESLLNTRSPSNSYYATALTNLVQTLHFRHEMLEALAN